MRIQHNIAAMNSYRNYNNNTNALSKNLEKLSSGYKINRAGDDAAGLAISEKMRAQITGLNAATKNVKDGISLVKTAEGAMQEVHDMLNRMDYLATQSANGTYDNDVDRANLQKEVDSLRTEIDRIADSSNFNGLNLLDGSLSAEGASKAGTVTADVSKLGIDITANAEDIAAVKGEYTTNKFGADITLAAKDSLSFTVNYTDSEGKDQTAEVKLFIKDATTNGKVYLDDGSEEGIELTSAAQDGTTAGKITDANVSKLLAEALNKSDEFKGQFDINTATAGKLVFTAREGGAAGAVVNSINYSHTAAATGTVTNTATYVEVTKEPAEATKAYDLSKATAWDGKADSLKDSIMEINGKKFVFVQNSVTLDADKLKTLNDAGVEHWVETAAANPVGTEVTTMAEKIAKETGLEVLQGTVANGEFTKTADEAKVIFKDSEFSSNGKGEGLRLQIGDTAEKFNQLTVSIGDMHAKSLGIGSIDISTQEGAAKAIENIKNAINSVSSTRGDLGAIQNRLEHTQKNLSVMTENIQDAESTIRDTDVADEMMTYTKNNILIQSAQAMLAQANQMPQGVLQLLQ